MTERKVLIILFAILAILLIVFLADIWGDKAFADTGEYYILCRPQSRVNVRNKPAKTASVTAWVECGQKVTVEKYKNGFAFVTGLASEIPDGWIYAGYLVDEEPVVREYKAEVWEGNVIARKCVNGKRLRVLKEGKIVTVFAKTHTWAVTNKGFVMCDWLKEVEE